jgi:hypothetical protein
VPVVQRVAAERLAFYAELMPAPGAAAEPARVFTELAALAGAEVAERHIMLAHTRYESLLHGLVAILTASCHAKFPATSLGISCRNRDIGSDS